jgi:hypothetical protein
MDEENRNLKLEIEDLKTKNADLEKRLKLYTNPVRNQRYYENNCEIIKERAKVYIDKLKNENPEKLKEYRKTAYLNRKEKLKQQQQQQQNTNEV